MPNFTVDQVREIMNHPTNIRNISVIAHVDHGKSTLTDSLLAKAGMMKAEDAGTKRLTDTRDDEATRGITIKSTGVTLYYELQDKHKSTPGMTDIIKETSSNEKFLVNLIDSPGHVDFNMEVTAALRLTDGAVVVVDCIEGVCVQTETVLRQALAERVKPILVMNKMDRIMLELQKDPEEAYQSFLRVIENVNVIISNYEDPKLGDVQVDPTKGTVVFGSGYQAWGFTLWDFAKLWEKKMGADPNVLVNRLWGDNFYDPVNKKWVTKMVTEDGRKLKRGFVQFVMDPIVSIFSSVTNQEVDKIKSIVTKMDINIRNDEIDELKNEPKKLIKSIMQKFMNMADTLLQAVVVHLPSPVKAQKYRAEKLYSGPIDDEAYKAIYECDKNGPVMMYVSKMVPASDNRFYAFGRVFSGTVSTGQKVRIMGPNYVFGGKKDLSNKNIQRTVVMMAGKVEAVDDVPCGNTVALVGIDDCLIKTGTITTLNNCHIFNDMKFSVSPVVNVAVAPKNGADLPKLVDGIQKLMKSDPCLTYRLSEEGEHTLGCVGELHLEIVLKDLQDDYAKIPLIVSDPVVPYRETVIEESEMTVMSKSPNKHNRLYYKAEPINPDLCTQIEEKQFDLKRDHKEVGKDLETNWGWTKDDSLRIWQLGPEGIGTDALVDQTKGVQYLNEIKDSGLAGFAWTCGAGPLAGEPVRGVKFNLQDVCLHSDSVHRGNGQLLGTYRRVFFAAMLTAKPRFMEPVYLVNITGPQSVSGAVYGVMNKKRGQVISEEMKSDGVTIEIKAYLPVSESFGFNGDLRGATGGKAFPQCSFSHWQVIESDPLEEGTRANKLMMEIRKRKDMKLETPNLDDYHDKL